MYEKLQRMNRLFNFVNKNMFVWGLEGKFDDNKDLFILDPVLLDHHWGMAMQTNHCRYLQTIIPLEIERQLQMKKACAIGYRVQSWKLRFRKLNGRTLK